MDPTATEPDADAQAIAEQFLAATRELAEPGREAERWEAIDDVIAQFEDEGGEDVVQPILQLVLGPTLEVLAGGDPERARQQTQAVIARYARRDGRLVRILRACARYNLGVIEYDAGDVVAAEQTLVDLLADTEADPEPTVQSFRAIAAVRLGRLLTEEGRAADALRTLEDLIERHDDDGDSDEPLLRWVTEAIRVRGHALVREGRLDEAEAAWREVAGKASEALATDECAAHAASDLARLSALRARAGHAFTNPVALDARRTLRKLSRRRKTRDMAEGIHALHADLIAREDRESGQLHDAAVHVIWECITYGEPFVLFLRNFDVETPTSRSARMGVASMLGASEVEPALARAFDGVLPLLGLANPLNRLPMIGSPGVSPVPKLELRTDSWEEHVSRLVALAHLIVVEIDTLSPGVGRELELIRAAGKQERTVLIFAPEGDRALHDAISRGMGIKPGSPHRKVSVGSPELSDFKRAVDHADVPYESPRESQLFGDLLAGAA